MRTSDLTPAAPIGSDRRKSQNRYGQGRGPRLKFVILKGENLKY